MKKENLVNCEICGREFNNVYRHGLRRFACSEGCYLKLRAIRRMQVIKENQARRRKRWKERVRKHLCGDCGKKVKPIYPSRCKGCRGGIAEYNRRRNAKQSRTSTD